MSDLGAQIREAYANLSPAECRIADTVLASPDLMVGFTATELADRAGVSKPTVTRFVSKLGLNGFQEFRERARQAHRVPRGSPLDLLARELDVTEGDLGTLITETLAGDVDNLQRTYLDLDEGKVDGVVELLVRAPRVVFADFRKQHALAAYSGALFNAVRSDVRVLPVAGTSPADGLLDLDARDLVVMFPFRRPQRDHDLLSRAVVDVGATLVTIGDRYPNPATERADVHFECASDGVGVFDSLVAPMSLINLLFTATVNRLGAPAQRRLATLEHEHELFETFVSREAGNNHHGRRR